MLNSVQFEHKNNVAIIRLNRPEVHNSVDAVVMTRLERILDEIEADPEIRVIIITGAGEKTFCSGGDLRYFSTLNSREACLQMSRRMQTILDRFYRGKRVTIAAVNGQALGGGCEILTACHFRIAADNATFSFRQAPNGIITGWGGGQRLFKLIGKSQALRLFLAGELIDAGEALRLGLIGRIVKPGKLRDSALDFADKINQNSRAAVEAFLDLALLAEIADWEMLKTAETELFTDLWMGEDFQAFVGEFGKKK